MIEIVFLGECMVEDHDDGTFRFGGDTLNSALYLSRLTHFSELKVYYATAVGVDLDSQLLISQWRKEGIDTSMVTQSVDRCLGRYQITVDSSGERQFNYQRDKSAACFYFQSNPTVLYKFLTGNSNRYLYLSGISLAIISANDRVALFELLAQFKSAGGKVIFDNNYRPKLWKMCEVESTYHQIMALADIAFLTDEDEYALYPNCTTIDDILDRIQKLGIKEAVIKQGKNPCIIANQQSIYQVAAQTIAETDIVDTSAAGDSFAAGYLAKRLLGVSAEQAAVFGHQIAGEIIQHSGAIIARTAMKPFII